MVALPASKYVNANGVRLHFLEWGSTTRPTVLMLHGIGLCAQVWNWTAKRLAPNYQVLAFDLRGHGDSEDPGHGYDFEQLGRDLVEATKALGLERPHVVGHSAGGSAAIIANALSPGLLGPTMVIDSRVGGSRALSSRPDMRDRPTRTRRKRSIWDSRDAMFQAYSGRRVFKTWEKEIFADYIAGCARDLPSGQVELKCPPEVEAVFYEQRAALNTSPYVKGLSGAYLFLLGNYSGAQTLDDPGIQEFLREAPNTQVKVAAQGSHFLPMEQPKLVLDEIEGFLLQNGADPTIRASDINGPA